MKMFALATDTGVFSADKHKGEMMSRMILGLTPWNRWATVSSVLPQSAWETLKNKGFRSVDFSLTLKRLLKSKDLRAFKG